MYSRCDPVVLQQKAQALHDAELWLRCISPTTEERERILFEGNMLFWGTEQSGHFATSGEQPSLTPVPEAPPGCQMDLFFEWEPQKTSKTCGSQNHQPLKPVFRGPCHVKFLPHNMLGCVYVFFNILKHNHHNN